MKHRFVLVLALLNAAAANAATITVFSNADNGPGTLRQAIFDASPGDTIRFAIQWTFPSSSREIGLGSELLIDKNLSIEGPTGADRLTVRWANSSGSVSVRVLRVSASVTAATISNLTISGATSGSFPPGPGGGISNAGTLTITNSTVAGNVVNGGSGCGGGVFNAAGSFLNVRSTIIALNTGPNGPDVCGSLTSQNYNLIGNSSGASITPSQAADQIGTPASPIDPRLGTLQYNGGQTFTRALQSNSPAVDHGDPNGLPRDQRGYLRAGVPDIGAFEFHGSVPVSLANISTRLPVQSGDNALIGGFIVTGAQPKKIIVRALGPSLPLSGVLANPILELRNGSGGLIAVNDNWRSDQETEIENTGIPPAADLESAIVTTVPANNSGYTAIMRGVNGGTGIGVVEIYDLDRTVDSKFGNISTRGFVQTGDSILIGGVIVFGQDPMKVIVRGIGPSLSVPGALADPTLELRDGSGTLLASNDNWRIDQEAEIIATTIPPNRELESAIVRTLAPGNYTAILRGVDDGVGIGVVEAHGLY